MTNKEVNPKIIFPNAVTMLALAFGVSSINMSLWGNWKMAVIFIILAGLFDFLDGKVARLLGVSSKFGAELDSLSDFVSFGVAPGLLMYQWSMNAQYRLMAMNNIAYKPMAVGIAWCFILFLAMCCATRLARFNTMLDEKQPDYWKHFFMGVPAPAGGALAMLPLILWLATNQTYSFLRSPLFAGTFVVFSGVMMASKIPTFCLKHIHIDRDYAWILLVFLLLLIAGLMTYTWIVMSVLGVFYLLSIPASICLFLKLKKKVLSK